MQTGNTEDWDWDKETHGHISFSISSKTVCFETILAVRTVVGPEPTNTFERYNEIALAFLSVCKPEVYVAQTEAEKKEWQLGGMTQEVADELLNLLEPSVRGEVVLLTEK